MTQTDLYLINTLTNMHVGSGDVNYGLVDNLIQCDAITGYPNINSSSLKGALKDSCTEVNKNTVFGSGSQQGTARFFEGKLLALPARSDKASYLMVTSREIIQSLITDLTLFCNKNYDCLNNLLSLITDKEFEAVVFDESLDGAIVEDLGLSAKQIDKENLDLELLSLIFGDNLVIVSHEMLKMLCDENHLPIIARNNLNPENKNLFYEQVLPRYTRLYFFVMSNGDINLDNKVVQIGANATIGYGYCQLNNIKALINKTQSNENK